MQSMQPRVKELQAKFANDPERLQVRCAGFWGRVLGRSVWTLPALVAVALGVPGPTVWSVEAVPRRVLQRQNKTGQNWPSKIDTRPKFGPSHRRTCSSVVERSTAVNDSVGGSLV